MSPVALLRELDGRAIGLAALIAFVAPVPLGLLVWAITHALTGEAETALHAQAAVATIAYFAAPFVGAAIAARFSRSLPLTNGMVVSLIGGALAVALGRAESMWFPVVILGAALGAGALGAVIGRAMRPHGGDI
jgi:hypothetical protein